MGSKLAWLVAFVGAVVFWGSARGTLWSALQTYASGGSVDVIHTAGIKAQAANATTPVASSTVILTMPAGATPPGGTQTT